MIEYNEFETLEIKIEKLKEWGLLSPKAKVIKKFIYKGTDKPIQCEIIGYLIKTTGPKCISPVYETAIIMTDSEIHRISIDYLKEMQKS